MQRVFIVGCPRSGTTLVQALLARYPGVHSFPETGFFEALFGGMERRWNDAGAKNHTHWYHRLGIAHARGWRRLRELEQEFRALRVGPTPHTVGACIRRYIALLDNCARSSGCSIWVEKTPNHLVYVDDIARHVPDAKFIHVLRNGEDVVASIVDADLDNPTRAFHGGIKRWVGRWNRAVELQLACLGAERHHVLCLEDIVEDFSREWQRLCAFLELDSSAPLSPTPSSSIANISDEPWKRDALSGQVRRPDQKSESLFGPRLRAWMRNSLLPYEDVRARIASDSRT